MRDRITINFHVFNERSNVRLHVSSWCLGLAITGQPLARSYSYTKRSCHLALANDASGSLASTVPVFKTKVPATEAKDYQIN